MVCDTVTFYDGETEEDAIKEDAIEEDATRKDATELLLGSTCASRIESKESSGSSSQQNHSYTVNETPQSGAQNGAPKSGFDFAHSRGIQCG